MSKTLWSAAVAVGLVAGVAGAPPSALAGGHAYTSTTIGVSNYSSHGGYGVSARYGWTYVSDHGHGWGRGWDYDRHYRGYYGNRHYHDHHGTADALLGFMVGALAVGVIASAHDHNPGPAYSYDAPSGAPQGYGCHIVNRIGPDSTGQTVKFAATMCYDRSGTPYIAPGTQHIIERY
jgi:hypothetical protein